MTSPDPSSEEERRGGLVRRVLASGSNPEERLEEMLAQRRRELDAHAEQLHASIAELERREELLRDSRTSVERMLRLGTSDLEAREEELAGYLRELTAREKELAEAEEELGERRQELGAVELKRAAVERRERALDAREAELAEREAAAPRLPSESEHVELAFVPGAEYLLVELDAAPLSAGLELEVADDVFVVTRIGRSPLPGDTRRCAYLTRGPRGLDDPLPGSS
jgi:chromosome segregation ATPase